ncbi:hypothetical protein [Antrihabitans cavernicola]|uniref:Uncharacterized protein n=1 Tax=Antrihabitans cavernicola TaxID=2495913 RepID=A0A5A7S5L0_9NOCA|nr:hypothetical protein [Spelaeibacter cavernicola]KAA0017006.1 hypothetical protein FOY51_25530 [Spelaeibacter cavernicola]
MWPRAVACFEYEGIRSVLRAGEGVASIVLDRRSSLLLRYRKMLVTLDYGAGRLFADSTAVERADASKEALVVEERQHEEAAAQVVDIRRPSRADVPTARSARMRRYGRYSDDPRKSEEGLPCRI